MFVFFCSDIHSIIKLSLQSVVMVLIVSFAYSTLYRLVKPVTSRLYKLFSGAVVPGIRLTLFFCVVMFGRRNFHYQLSLVYLIGVYHIFYLYFISFEWWVEYPVIYSYLTE